MASHGSKGNISVQLVANAIEGAVRAIRKARGKLNPEDCAPGTAVHRAVTSEFLADCIGSLGEDAEGESPEADDYDPGAVL